MMKKNQLHRRGNVSQRMIDLKARLVALKQLKAGELKGDNNLKYIADLNDSIVYCERELEFLKDKPASPGYEMVDA